MFFLGQRLFCAPLSLLFTDPCHVIRSRILLENIASMVMRRLGKLTAKDFPIVPTLPASFRAVQGSIDAQDILSMSSSCCRLFMVHKSLVLGAVPEHSAAYPGPRHMLFITAHWLFTIQLEAVRLMNYESVCACAWLVL